MLSEISPELSTRMTRPFLTTILYYFTEESIKIRTLGSESCMGTEYESLNPKAAKQDTGREREKLNDLPKVIKEVSVRSRSRKYPNLLASWPLSSLVGHSHRVQ